MTHVEQLQLAGRFAQALGSADAEALAAVCTHDVYWSIPGTSAVAGRHDGVEAIIAVDQTLRAHQLDAGLPTLLFGESCLIAMLHEVGHRGGQHLALDVALHVEHHDGRIAAISSHIADLDAFDRYLAEPAA